MKAKVEPLHLTPDRRALVISDIHGNLPLLQGLLSKVGFGPDDDLFILGDILEKAATSLETLRYVMDLSQEGNVHTLLGNNDNIILAFTDGVDHIPDAFFEYWFRLQGEKSTLVQMAHLLGLPIDDPADYATARAAIRERFRPELDFLRNLPHIFVNDDYLLVHGGVPREDRLDELDAYGCMKNDDFRGQGLSFRRWVVVGHWPVTLYHTHIPSAAPILDYDRHIASIDGGCTLKWDGQLNALILPTEPEGEFSSVAYDGLPVLTARDDQEPSADSINIRWSEHEITVLERGPEFCRCRHDKTGRELDILTEYIFTSGGKTICEDSTDYRLPVKAGDRLAVVRRTSRGSLCKKDGATGWYFGRLA